MKSLQQWISQATQALEALVDNARMLRDFSLQVGSEEELSALQDNQAGLLRELEQLDDELQANYPGQMEHDIQDIFHQKLEEFRRYNQEYIENLKQSHGLIQFDLEYLDEETRGEVPSLAILHKLTNSKKKNKKTS